MDVAGVGISNPGRALFPRDGITKLDLARYYAKIADRVVPHVAGRPLTLVRCGKSIDDCMFLRHGRSWGPKALRRVHIQEKTKVGEYLVADDIAGIVSLVQMDIIVLLNQDPD
jgi:bifunctional non-homologous end joining protein LigD